MMVIWEHKVWQSKPVKSNESDSRYSARTTSVTPQFTQKYQYLSETLLECHSYIYVSNIVKIVYTE